MGFISVSTYNFRNLENCTVNTDSRNIFLTGSNGQGKTNFIEAVYNLCFGNSFRTKYDALLVKEDEKEMSIKGIYTAGSGEKGERGDRNTPDINTSDINTVFLTITDGKKNIQLNGKKIKDRKEIIHNIPCIVFSHDDISYVSGSPDKRRQFFNQTISLFDCSFLENLRRYERILKSRNSVLKDGDQGGILDILDRQLAEEGLEITVIRKKIIEEFNSTFSSVFSKVSGLDAAIRIIYRPSWNCESDADEIVDKLSGKRYAETAAGTTLFGPHRDRFYFYMNRKDFTKIASTGQTRLVSLSLKTAQAEFYRQMTGKKPLVLLDDVLLELDKTRKIRFIDAFPEYEQAFFTFLPGEDEIISGKTGLYYNVKNGVIRET